MRLVGGVSAVTFSFSLSLIFALVFTRTGASQASFPADESHAEALRLLEAGEAEAAETAARKAVELSSRFEPEREIGERPERGLLFDDMIARARSRYRARRARYFRSLGDALALQEHFRAARKAYVRSARLAPTAELHLVMADDPDLEVSERVERLLEAYLAAREDEGRVAIEQKLLATGAFRNRNALKASLDRKRFAEFSRTSPEVELLRGAFGSLLLTTDAGTLPTAERFAAGARMVVYVPTEGCSRCSEELDGLTHLAEEAGRSQSLLDVVAFVRDADLPIARRIARLMAMPLGVARRELVPDELDATFAPSGEIRVVARGGLTQIRMPLAASSASREIRRQLDRVFDFLDAPGLPSEEEPERASVSLVELGEGSSDRSTLFEWIDTLERLEVGPAPIEDLFDRLSRLAQRVTRSDAARSLDLGSELLSALSRIEGGGAVKVRALGLLGERVGERLLERATALDPSVVRTAPVSRGSFFVDSGRVIGDVLVVAVQRSFETGGGFIHASFVLEHTGSDLGLVWAGIESGTPAGVRVLPDGAAFVYLSDEGCRGVRLVRSEVLFDRCPASLLDGVVIEERIALVDGIDALDANSDVEVPRFYVRYGDGENDLAVGIRLFRDGDFEGALSAFERAADSIDPVAPYDASDLLFNRARALHALGRRTEALEMYRSIGDVSYQYLVDERAAEIESGR